MVGNMEYLLNCAYLTLSSLEGFEHFLAVLLPRTSIPIETLATNAIHLVCAINFESSTDGSTLARNPYRCSELCQRGRQFSG